MQGHAHRLRGALNQMIGELHRRVRKLCGALGHMIGELHQRGQRCALVVSSSCILKQEWSANRLRGALSQMIGELHRRAQASWSTRPHDWRVASTRLALHVSCFKQWYLNTGKGTPTGFAVRSAR